MIGYFSKVYKVAAALVTGHLITLKYMLKPSITIHYPTEKLTPYERFRGALTFDAATCISCSMCVKACPSNCIALENAVSEAGKKVAKVAWYSIDFGKCNFCRLCEESSPPKPKSVWHSLDYEVVFASRDEMVRCWKKDFPFIGKYFDRRTQDFKDPEGQVCIHEVPPRRS